MHIDLVIPVQQATKQLETTVNLLNKYKNSVPTRLHILERSDINVSEARQQVLDDPSYGPYICYLDDDSEMVMDHWLDDMVSIMLAHDDAGAVFAAEQWGMENPPQLVEKADGFRVSVGSGGTPAACMLIDKRKLPSYCRWDQYIGLRNSWLGGDYEEVDFSYRLQRAGLALYKTGSTYFRHTGGKTYRQAFRATDRAKCVSTMSFLLQYRWMLPHIDDEYFKGLKYVKADPNNDCMLAPGYTLRECYHDLMVKHNLTKKKWTIERGYN